MGKITLAAIEMFVSKHLAALMGPKLVSLKADFPDREWIATWVLSRIFVNPIKDEHVSLAFVMVRRAEAAFDEWELAVEALTGIEDGHSVTRYFKGLRHLEAAMSALYQAYEFGRAALEKAHGGWKLFDKADDGSPYQRLNFVYNTFRHHDPTALPAGELHAQWITDDAVHVRGSAKAGASKVVSLTFDELREMLSELGRIANATATGKVSTPAPPA